MKHRVELIQPRSAEDRFPGVDEIPFYARDPRETCATCRFLVRLRQHERDDTGQLVCKESAPNVTSVVDHTGRVGGLSQSFVPSHPQSWCFRWQPRAAANGAELNAPVLAQ